MRILRSNYQTQILGIGIANNNSMRERKSCLGKWKIIVEKKCWQNNTIEEIQNLR